MSNRSVLRSLERYNQNQLKLADEIIFFLKMLPFILLVVLIIDKILTIKGY